jgi:D-alanine-D-alanine ligase
MKIAIIYNRDSQAVINLFGTPNREKYGLETIQKITNSLESGGHQVQAFEGDKNIIHKLEEFMPSVISGERPGLVFNLSYGIQGRARYAHIPGILEMLGIPYVGSGPETHVVALDKVMTKMVLIQKGLPTPHFAVLDKPDFDFPLKDNLQFPLIVKPKDEAVSFGLRIVNSEEELREGVKNIYKVFKSPTLVEEYIDGREVNVGLLGNDPVQALPPVELKFSEGEKIYTYEDKVKTSGRTIEKLCPAPLTPEQTDRVQSLAIAAFKALDCYDSARVDFRLDQEGNPYILEINSMASLGPGGSYVFAADKIGLDYTALANRLIEIASQRYFGPAVIDHEIKDIQADSKTAAFSYLTQNRDRMEEDLKVWTNMPSWSDDPVGLGAVVNKFAEKMKDLGMEEVEEFTNRRSAWTWQTQGGFAGGTLLVAPIDIPRGREEGYSIPFRRDPEWLFGEGIASSRAGILCILQALAAMDHRQELHPKKIGIFIYSDEGRGLRYSSPVLHKAASQAGQVLVLQPGYQGGKVVDQRRGSRKFSILVEGASQRIGSQNPQKDVMAWFIEHAAKVRQLSSPENKVTAAVQEVHSERYSILLPHRVRSTVYLSFLDAETADAVEKQIRTIFTPPQGDKSDIKAFVERLEERPSLKRRDKNAPLIEKLKNLSEEWKLPFGVEASLLPSAAGIIPPEVPVVCGFGPASLDLYTPFECVNRGGLLQRTLLLTLFLMEE